MCSPGAVVLGQHSSVSFPHTGTWVVTMNYVRWDWEQLWFTSGTNMAVTLRKEQEQGKAPIEVCYPLLSADLLKQQVLMSKCLGEMLSSSQYIHMV